MTKLADKLVTEFDNLYNTGDIEGFKPDALVMALHEFSNLYQIKKYILVNSLLKN
jgi:hypothetical protein